VESLHVGLPSERYDTVRERAFRTGFWKERVEEPRWLSRLNLDGDGQADLVHHGGVDKALLAYSAGNYPRWREELGITEIGQGAWGENVTVDGLDEDRVCIGDTWQLGEAVVQVTQARRPCWKLEARWGLRGLLELTQRTGRTGWYHRVLSEGLVGPGHRMVLIERPHPGWTVHRAGEVMGDPDARLHDLAELASLPELSSSWRMTLHERLRGRTEDPAARTGTGRD
jgi:MOSC domain-containing protein YiiM